MAQFRYGIESFLSGPTLVVIEMNLYKKVVVFLCKDKSIENETHFPLIAFTKTKKLFLSMSKLR